MRKLTSEERKTLVGILQRPYIDVFVGDNFNINNYQGFHICEHNENSGRMTAEIVAEMARKIVRKTQECFVVIGFDSNYNVLFKEISTIGLAIRSMVHPRETFQKAIKKNATSIVIAHNHPSGNVNPSEDDIACTKRLIESGRILGIPVLDHVIVSKDKHYSFVEHGLCF